MPELVALQTRVPQFETPLESQGKALQLRQMLNSGQVADMELQQRRQAVADDQAARAAFSANPTDSAARLSALAGVSPAAYGAEAKRQADLAKAGADTEKTKLETAKQRINIMGNAMGFVRDNPTPENALRVISDLQQHGIFTPEQAAQYTSQVQANPNAIRELAQQGYQSALEVKDQLMKYETRDAGGTVQTIGIAPATGQVRTLSSMAKTQSPDSIASNATAIRGQNMTQQTAREGQKTQLQIAGMNSDGTPQGDVEAMAQGIAAGKLSPISGFALAKPRGQAIMARVMEINPQYDTGDFQAKNQALKAFSTGKEGASLRSFNVAVDHLNTLGELADKLKNGDMQAFNKVGNYVAQQTGNPAPTDFDAVKGIVAKEVVKSIVAGGGGVSEREELSHLLDNAKSPAQLKGVINHYKELMDAQRSGLLDQYQRTTGRADGEQVFAPKRGVQGTAGNTNAKGWVLHTDAAGNRAYVSPDGKQFEEVK